MDYKQIIYFGAPGTGKSFLVKTHLDKVPQDLVFRTTIHPEFTYSDFVGQLLPESDGKGGVKFVFKPGPFTEALKMAYSDRSKKVFLVLEELSRGNVAAVFGDIFQLLDRDAFFESIYPVRNKNIADQIVEILGDEIKLPSNLNIIGTVNTNDQSVFPMDTAFKRRFEWEYVAIDPVTDERGNRLSKLNNPKITINRSKTELFHLSWHDFYMALNDFITNKENGLGRNEDRQIGQFFLEFGDELIIKSYSYKDKEAEEAQEKINHMIKNKLLLYLWQDVQGSSSMNNRRMFDTTITSFSSLFSTYGNEKVFCDTLINTFLEPGAGKYPYE